MARKDPLKDWLARLAAARENPATDEAETTIREALAKGPGLAVAKAAALVAGAARDREEAGGPLWERAEARGAPFFSDLLSSFARCCDHPVKLDKGAFGKTAALEALDSLDYPDPEPFLRAVGYVQLEPSMGPPVDAAPPFRARGLAGLVRLRHPDRLLWMADLLWDPWLNARIGAARAAVMEGTDAAEALLRAKALAGDKGSDIKAMADDGGAEVLGEVFAGLMALDAGRNAPFVARFLRAEHDAVRDQAAMALGECRQAEGLRCLADAWDAAAATEEKRRLAFGVALNGTSEALVLLAAWLRAAGAAGQRMIRETATEVFGEGSDRLHRLLDDHGTR